MSEQQEDGDGLDAFRGLMVACGLSALLWAAVIGAYCLGRSSADVPDVPHDAPRSVQADKVT